MKDFLIGGGLALMGGAAVTTGVLHALRQRAYRRHLSYNPQQDSTDWVSGPSVVTVSAGESANGFIMPEIPPGAIGGLLELAVRAQGFGDTFDPSLEIDAPGFHDAQYLERGVRGRRYFNLSRLLASGVPPGETVTLRGRHLAWQSGSARVHLSSERLHGSDRVFVVAPHPDDAEIAAFGLYADTNATVVTVTAGDGSDRWTGNDGGLTVALPRGFVAMMRVWDSITIPQFGGVGPEKALNLCYPDEKLGAMREDCVRDFQSHSGRKLDFLGLRQLNRSTLLCQEAICSWKSLITDLAHLISETKPTVIVTPHPWLDPHSDHLFTTVAVCEALRDAGLREGRLFFYANHNRRSELWPFGPAGSGVAPFTVLQSDVVDCDGFYSHPLSEERQREKFVALEAMHDLRDVGAPQPQTPRALLQRMRSDLSALLNGLGRPATSYFRRAVRPDELFFVTSFPRGQELCERVLATHST